jgi:hypothetical protein
LGKDIKLTVYDNFTHAFLQWDSPFKEHRYSRIAVGEAEAALRELLSK